jgi:mitochondrial fission protein ELM1
VQHEKGALAGLPGWVITDGKAGMDAQAVGVADALGLAYERKRVEPTGAWRLLAPWAPVSPSERFGRPSSPFAPPWPAVAIATGRLSIPYMRALVRRAGPATYTVVLQDPKTGLRTADLIWVPEHDSLRGANVITSLTAPHSFTPERLAALRSHVPAEIARLPRPRIAVLLGGDSGVYRFTPQDEKRLAAALAHLAQFAGSFLVTPSRRTGSGLAAAVDSATAGRARVFWDGSGDNPYPDFLANADVFVVTADSINMASEAAATGQPIHVFFPRGGSAKFQRFHDALQRHGATRPLPDVPGPLEPWSYPPLDSAREIATEVERRWTRRRRMLPGLMNA